MTATHVSLVKEHIDRQGRLVVPVFVLDDGSRVATCPGCARQIRALIKG